MTPTENGGDGHPPTAMATPPRAFPSDLGHETSDAVHLRRSPMLIACTSTSSEQHLGGRPLVPATAAATRNDDGSRVHQTRSNNAECETEDGSMIRMLFSSCNHSQRGAWGISGPLAQPHTRVLGQRDTRDQRSHIALTMRAWLFSIGRPLLVLFMDIDIRLS